MRDERFEGGVRARAVRVHVRRRRALPIGSGNTKQLARMSSDGVAIIKGQCSDCVTATACVSGGGDGFHANGDSGVYSTWMAQYLTDWQTFGNLPDVGAWHPYPAHTNIVPPPFPETNLSTASECTAGATGPPNKYCRDSIVDQIKVWCGVFDAHGLHDRPMIASEGAFGPDTVLVTDPTERAAWPRALVHPPARERRRRARVLVRVRQRHLRHALRGQPPARRRCLRAGP